MSISPDDSSSHSILMIAAEASSCMYAKNLMQYWQQSFPESSFFGIGDKELQGRGMECLGFAEDLAVVGLQEVLTHFPEIRKTYNSIVSTCEKKKPKFAVLFDYPGFNLRLAKKLKGMGIPVVYYISPQLWAWKKGRVEQVRSYVDDMLVVFPFEVDFYKEHGIQAHFVGHPLVEVIEKEKEGFINSQKSKEPLVLGLMPGSRKSEVKFNLETQLETADLLKQKFQDLQVRLLLAPTLDIKNIQQALPIKTRPWLQLEQKPPTEMISGCDLILSASGTATLQVALCHKPMVVMYKMNSVTAFLAKRLVNTVDYFCIVNLIAGREIVPERFQDAANPKALAELLGRVCEDPAYRAQVIDDLEATEKQLGGGGATANVIQFLKKKYMGIG